jgi:SAM-dependent methyltransferase
MTPAADYGLDAPGVVRNLLLAAGAGACLTMLIWLGILPRAATLHLRSGLDLSIGLLGLGLGPALGCGVGAAAMVWDSRVGKLARRERLLDALPWTGAEQVLDVGCGRGLLLIGAARRVPAGSAVGLDLWRAEDLSANRPEATLANAGAEGVLARVRVETGDMRQMPFPDASFDRVVSRAAIHNLPSAPDRAQAVREIARVLRPGGWVLIDDIRHLGDYRAVLQAHGCEARRRLDSPVGSIVWSLITLGSLHPGTWVFQRVA